MLTSLLEYQRAASVDTIINSQDVAVLERARLVLTGAEFGEGREENAVVTLNDVFTCIPTSSH